MKTEESTLTAVLEPPVRPKPAAAVEHEAWGDEEEKPTGFKKWRTPLIVAVVSIFAVYHVGKKLANADGSSAKKEAMTVVAILPPPPVAPPPPPPPPKEEVREDKEVDDKEDTEPEPEPTVTTAAAGKGSSGIQIAAGRNNPFYRKPADPGIQAKYRGFAGQVARAIEDALRRNPSTKNAAGTAPIRVWLDSAGRITRAKLDSATGNSAIDNAVNDSLVGLQCPGITPDGMPQPIRLRISLRRPN